MIVVSQTTLTKSLDGLLKNGNARTMTVQQKIKARLDMSLIIQETCKVWDQLRNPQSLEMTSQGEDISSKDTKMTAMTLNMCQSLKKHIGEKNESRMRVLIKTNQGLNLCIIGPADID